MASSSTWSSLIDPSAPVLDEPVLPDGSPAVEAVELLRDCPWPPCFPPAVVGVSHDGDDGVGLPVVDGMAEGIVPGCGVPVEVDDVDVDRDEGEEEDGDELGELGELDGEPWDGMLLVCCCCCLQPAVRSASAAKRSRKYLIVSPTT